MIDFILYAFTYDEFIYHHDMRFYSYNIYPMARKNHCNMPVIDTQELTPIFIYNLMVSININEVWA